MMTRLVTRIRQDALRVIFSTFGQIPPVWRSRLQGSAFHSLYLKFITPLSRGLNEQVFRISTGPLSGYKFLLNPDSWERRYVFGEYEPEVVTAITQLCKPGMLVLDIGAHYGYFSLIMANLVGPEGRCLVFEPSSSNCEHIKYVADANHIINLDLFDIAVGVTDEIAEFLLDDSGFMGHLAEKGGGEFEVIKTEKVQVVTLDKFLNDISVGPVGLMKIDVEGSEADVVSGANRRIVSDRPILIVEVHTFLSPDQHARPFIRSLYELNYDVLDIEHRRPISADKFMGGHVVAIPRSST